MKLIFWGTRGNIEHRTRQHFKHSVLAVVCHGRRVVIDCGTDWLEEVSQWDIDAIVLTHAHPDHCAGLAHGAPCPVFATRQTWQQMKRFPINQRCIVHLRRPTQVANMRFEAFAVEHSLLAPAVGYRITAGKITIFYCPDLVSIRDRHEALRGIIVYVGDGATITRPLVRRRGKRLFGHAPITTQLAWCRSERVPRAIITHCGTQIVTRDSRLLKETLTKFSHTYGLRIDIAKDGMELVLRSSARIGKSFMVRHR